MLKDLIKDYMGGLFLQQRHPFGFFSLWEGWPWQLVVTE